MLEEIFGLPTHVLVIHAAVVFVPLACVAAILFAVVPRWRWALRWPTVALAAVALASTGMAVLSGLAFFDRLGEPEFVEEHRDRGLLLIVLVGVLFVVVLVSAFVLGGPTRLIGAHDRPGAPRPVQIVTMVIVVLVAVATAVQVVRTGDEGTRAVWGALPSGQSSDVRDASSLR